MRNTLALAGFGGGTVSEGHEAAAPRSGPRMGEGDMPPELDAVNWAALLWGGLWVLGYRAWSWVGILFGMGALNLVVDLYLRRSGASPVTLIAVAVPVRLAWYALVVAFAFRANRHVWERERVLRESDRSAPRPAQLVSEYVATQRWWARLGLFFFAGSTLLGLWVARASVYVTQAAVGDVAIALVMIALFAYSLAAGSRPAPQS